MAEKSDTPPQVGGDIPDPDNVPIAHITGAVSNIANGQTIFLNLLSDRMAIGLDGRSRSDPIIAARLRFDLSVARNIRDQLDAHISGLTAAAPPDQKPN
ncbi:hypothetical protein [Methylobacterium sp. J-070]|uniref:hypothetical protein n=1 Tax=Methylobacterium sp. J-070 TaxID=2836650 RepID=UPI001FB91A6A|nr:hypothetical protein [Methylobacterium sp. J-070]MCJ2052620.1 hypothetical protein [Methylobacterium sp. J-070]